VAIDTAYKENKAITDVLITVTRNANAPKFQRSSYTSRISEMYPIGEDIVKISATDADNVHNNIMFF